MTMRLTRATKSAVAAETSKRRQRYAVGRMAEWVAAAVLWLRGYRVLSRRFKVRCGEVDLIAVRGGVVSFVEVKFRKTLDDAHAALRRDGALRMRRAADRWLAARPRYQGYEHRFDAMLILPWRQPIHLRGAL